MLDLVPLEPVDYLVLGHITEDLTPSGPRLGGTATFSALTARALGLRVGIVTALGDGASLAALQGIPVVGTRSSHTTTFENIYTSAGRVQVLHHRADPVPYATIPPAWRSPAIVHLGPVAGELDADIRGKFSTSLLGVTPQGWMRAWDESGQVTSSKWASADVLLPQAGAVVISREDVAGDEEWIEAMAHQTPLLAVTEGPAGAVLHWNGDRRRFHAPPVEQVDATGAGDIFAAAFFIRLSTTRDPWEAARFATRLASRSVTRSGLDSIPTKKDIEECTIEVL